MNTMLTGRQRHRVLRRLWRRPLLVLQVEEQILWAGIHDDFHPAASSGPGQTIEWRDAEVEDISTLVPRTFSGEIPKLVPQRTTEDTPAPAV